jgi:hypothetical protein
LPYSFMASIGATRSAGGGINRLDTASQRKGF